MLDTYRVDCLVMTSKPANYLSTANIPKENLLIPSTTGKLAIVLSYGHISHFISMSFIGLDVQLSLRIPQPNSLILNVKPVQ